MKILATTNEIISLENVRRVTINTRENKRTKNGVKITVTEYWIHIAYTDGESENIDFGEDNNAEKECNAIFQAIIKKLSED